MVWVIVANSNACRIYHFQKRPAELNLIKELNQQENRLKSRDFLTSDKPGHYRANDSARGAYSPHTDPKQVEYDQFARLIAHELNNERNKQAYESLVMVAEPHMHGLIYQHLDKHVQSMVVDDLKKDLVHLSDPELLHYLLKNTQFAQ